MKQLFIFNLFGALIIPTKNKMQIKEESDSTYKNNSEKKFMDRLVIEFNKLADYEKVSHMIVTMGTYKYLETVLYQTISGNVNIIDKNDSSESSKYINNLT